MINIKKNNKTISLPSYCYRTSQFRCFDSRNLQTPLRPTGIGLIYCIFGISFMAMCKDFMHQECLVIVKIVRITVPFPVYKSVSCVYVTQQKCSSVLFAIIKITFLAFWDVILANDQVTCFNSYFLLIRSFFTSVCKGIMRQEFLIIAKVLITALPCPPDTSLAFNTEHIDICTLFARAPPTFLEFGVINVKVSFILDIFTNSDVPWPLFVTLWQDRILVRCRFLHRCD